MSAMAAAIGSDVSRRPNTTKGPDAAKGLKHLRPRREPAALGERLPEAKGIRVTHTAGLGDDPSTVMAGLRPGHPQLVTSRDQDVDARDIFGRVDTGMNRLRRLQHRYAASV